ncbi:MFS transporter [Geobacter sp. DSM 9736]|uniref:MFS transporter n=1 Tax=Geobacter sp. DSM 9736 TaxID=1277350 RepID=UPI000B5E44C3|nr:MFS transporter [Geobacter sp. DSM 9736]SNB47759.1 Sugar phosphate permease [Geobacter sp. DSM 9736]
MKRRNIFIVLSCMYVLAYFFRVSMAVASKDLSTELRLDAVQLGTLSGAFFYAFALVQIPLGPLLDRFGGRIVISLTGLLTAAGAFLLAAAPSFYAALAGRILLGMGSACVLMGALKIFGNWYSPREFATISGLIIAIGNLGNLAATAPLAAAIARFGWREPFVAAGIIQALVVLLAYMIVRDRDPAQPHGSASTEHAGLLRGWHTVFTTPSFWLLSLLSFFWYANYMALQGLWGGPYLMDALGFSRKGAGSILLFTSVGFILGCTFVGKISDRLLKSRKWTLLIGQALLLLLMALFLGPAESIARPALPAVFLVIGLAVSSGVAIYPMVREMFPQGISATAMTAMNFFVLMGAATVQQAMGRMIEGYSPTSAGYPPEAYHTAFLLPVCGLAIALFLFLWVKDTSPDGGSVSSARPNSDGSGS